MPKAVPDAVACSIPFALTLWSVILLPRCFLQDSLLHPLRTAGRLLHRSVHRIQPVPRGKAVV